MTARPPLGEPSLIRPANDHDVPVLAALNAEVQELHFANRPDQFKPPEIGDLAAWFADRLRDPSARVWVAEWDGTVVGYVLVLVSVRPESPFRPANTWWELDQIGVLAAHRRTGVCRALVQKVLSEAQTHSIRDLELSAWTFNGVAQGAFRQLGFIPKSVRYELRVPAPDGS
jgi:ribosomal protein S18 acetylase RimI-like enzyme